MAARAAVVWVVEMEAAARVVARLGEAAMVAENSVAVRAEARAVEARAVVLEAATAGEVTVVAEMVEAV